MGNLTVNEAPGLPHQRHLFFVGAAVLALVFACVVAALAELGHEARLRARFDAAITLSRLVFDAQGLASRLHALRPAAAATAAAVRAVDVDLGQWQERIRDGAARAPLDAALPALDRLHLALFGLRQLLGPALEPAADNPLAAPALAARPDPGADPERAYADALDAAQGALLAIGRAAKETPAIGGLSTSELLSATVFVTGILALVGAVLFAMLFRRAQVQSRHVLSAMGELLRTDPLTGILNRRGLAEAMAVEMSRARRGSTTLALAMLDLDFFKRYNSRRGHDGGDALLRTAAQNWRRQLRPTDSVARYGGEEFTLILPNCDSVQACQLIERLRPVVPDSQTFSAGVAVWDETESADDLIRRADQALMHAKKSGRNRTFVAGQEDQISLPLSLGA